MFIPSINFHLWEPCNMRCHFCFATFQATKRDVLPKGHLPKEQALEVIKLLAEAGFQKITFAGGEPTLCPWLLDLIQYAKALGMTTMLVTNGSRLSPQWIESVSKYLDWITISIDSLSTTTNIESGRAIIGKKAIALNRYKELVKSIHTNKIKLKINTVVHAKNWEEDFSEFMQWANPKRWKIFQVLPIIGENDAYIQDFVISEDQFDMFIQRHRNRLGKSITIVPENNDAMTNSYAMLDPAGRFFNNTTGALIYSPSILDIGVSDAYNFVHPSSDNFKERGGLYDWS